MKKKGIVGDVMGMVAGQMAIGAGYSAINGSNIPAGAKAGANTILGASSVMLSASTLKKMGKRL